MSKPWYTKRFRRNLVDMHIESWNDEFLSQFDPQKYFECLQIAQVQSPMIYTHSHVGYCNWASESGEMHPNFGGEDKIAQLFDLCNGAGMDIIAYYSLIYNNWAYAHHSDWRMIDKDGNPSRVVEEGGASLMMDGRGRYGLVCPNNVDYREFLKLQFAELCGHYTFAGIFLDMTFWPMICYCDSCQKRYYTETGQTLPRNINWSDPAWVQFQQAREEWMGEFAQFTTDELKRLQPNLTVEHQFSTATHGWTYGVREAISNASDYAGGDLYGGFEQQSFVCKLYYGLTQNQPFEYMTSRCDPGLHDHTTTKSEETLTLHAYVTYAHHGAFLAIDAIDPRGTMNYEFYKTLGRVFENTKVYESYFTGKLCADTAIYFSMASKMNIAANTLDKHSYPHLAASVGAGIALRRAHIPYAVLADNCIGSVGDYKVLICSDVVVMTAAEEDALINYVENGGNLYLSGNISARLARAFFDMKITQPMAEQITYMRPNPKYEQLFCGMYRKDAPMTVFSSQIMSECGNKKIDVLAYITLPYTNPKNLERFAAIHSNPPGIDLDCPAIIKTEYGKGNIIWSAAAFESSEQPVHKQVFSNIIQMLGCNKIETNAMPMIEFTLFDDSEKCALTLHCVNMQEQSPVIPCGGFSVKIPCDLAVSGVKHVPDMADIAFVQQDGYVAFEVGRFELFDMYEIVYI